MTPELTIRKTIDAYRAANYAIRLPHGRRVVLRIGGSAPDALREFLVGVERERCAGFITAWNPFSQPAPREENRRCQRELLGRLRNEARRVFVGAGYAGDWREPSFAVFAVALARLDDLAREFRQNAILTLRANESVRLRLYRDDWRAALAGADVDFAA